jgi:hypothetical protein
MRAVNLKEKDKYFRGDELSATTVKASLAPIAVPAAAEAASH